MAINQLKAGAFLSYVSIGLNNIIGLTYTPFMLRMMGQSEYGLYSLVASVVAYLTVLDFGLGNAIVRYTAKFRAEGKREEQYEMFGMFLLLYTGIGILAFLIGLGLYFNVDRLFNATMDVTELYKICVMMLLMTFNLAFTFPMSIWGAIITAYENFVFQKLVNIARIVLNPMVMIVMLMMGYRAIGMVVVTTLFNVVTLLINWWYCKHRLHIQVHFGRFKWGFFKEVAVYSFWIFLCVFIDRVYWSTGQFVLGILKGAAVVAVYAIAIQLQSIYMGFSTAISGVFLPKVTAMVAQQCSQKEISDLFIRTGRIQYIIVVFILTGFIIFGKSFIVLWAGPEYKEAYWIALCFFIPLTIPMIQNLGISILQAHNRMKFRSIVYLIISVISLFISIPLAKLYSGIGFALGVAFALVVGQNVIMNIYYWKKMHIDIPLFWKEIGKISRIPLLFVLIGSWASEYIIIENVFILIMCILLFSIIYLVLFFYYSVNDYEFNLFITPIRKYFMSLWNVFR